MISWNSQWKTRERIPSEHTPFLQPTKANTLFCFIKTRKDDPAWKCSYFTII